MAEHPLPPRPTRAESFLGIHFDCHMRTDCTEVGRDVTHRMVERIIDLVSPDYIQCDCKGHPGVASYPTRVGTPAGGFVRDQLRIWREATAARGVALYVHYSGVIDAAACQHHPDWARVDERGEPDPRVTSVFGPYVDELLIPQLIELIDEYDIDGAWVDGECWGTAHDYGPGVLAAFRRRSGIRTVPRGPGQKGWRPFTRFCRQGFRDYLRRYVDALHAHCPRFQVTSNWAFSSHMPEPACADVDFLSGDYSMQDSVNAARLEARCLARQGKPWDLMAWSFCERRGEGCKSTKSVAQLQQEAAVVLALGGGFQAYFKQKRDGSIYEWTMERMAEVARFCRARQPFCHGAEPVPQVALLYSGAAFYRQADRPFSPWGGELVALAGVLRALLESQYSVEIVMEHHLEGRMGDWPLLVVPEWGYLKPSFRGQVADYVRRGASLLLIGPRAARLFADELGVRLVGKPKERAQWLEHQGALCGLKTLSQRVELGRGARPEGTLYPGNEPRGPGQPAASVARLGKGRIAATYANLGERYLRARTALARAFLADLVRRLFPRPLVEVEGSRCVDLCLARQDGRLCINLVNTAGPHAEPDVYTYDAVPPVGPLAITLRTARRPRGIRRQPANRQVRFRYADGQATFTLPRLAIHEVVVVE
ncbi:MAG: hypothetical protein ACLF0G_17370 [Candidatus Brocadiia bacterium]